MKGELVRTFLIVSVVTVLVWLFAESRTLRIEMLTMPVAIEQGGRTLVFRLGSDSEWQGLVDIEFAGPTGLLDSLRAPALEGVVLELGDELPGEPGVRTIDLRDAIRRDQLFLDSGVTIRRVTPETIVLEIDRLESVRVPVEVDLTGIETSGSVTVEPTEVEVRLPAAFRDRLPPKAIARLDTARLAPLTPGRRSEVSQVPVELDGVPAEVWGLRLVDSRVTVSLMLRARTQSLQLPELPVYVEISPADLVSWTVEIPPEDRVVSGITLTGPGSTIDRVRRGEIRIRAVVSISGESLERGVDKGTIELVGLPSGVVADFPGREVRLSVRRRPTENGP